MFFEEVINNDFYNKTELESLLQDKNVMELLGLLKQYKETNLENKVYETVNYVQNLENTLGIECYQLKGYGLIEG